MTHFFDLSAFMALLYQALSTAGIGLVFLSIVALLCYAFASNICCLVSSCIQTVKVKTTQYGLSLLVALLPHFIFFSAVANEVGYGFLAFLLTVLCSISVLVAIILVNVIACGIFNLIRSFEEIIPEPPLRRRASMTKQSSWSMYNMLFFIGLLVCLVGSVSAVRGTSNVTGLNNFVPWMDILRSSLKMKAPYYGSMFLRLFHRDFPTGWPTDCIVNFALQSIATSADGRVSKWCISITNFPAFIKFLKFEKGTKTSAAGVCLASLFNAGFVLRDICEYFWTRGNHAKERLSSDPSTTFDFYHEAMLPTWWEEVMEMKTYANGKPTPNHLYGKYRKSLRGFFVDGVHKPSAKAVFEAVAPNEPNKGRVYYEVSDICNTLEMDYLRDEQPQQELFMKKVIEYKSRD